MNNYLDIDTGGESYFYGSHLNSGCVPRLIVSFTFNVDGAILHQTLFDMMKRFPQMYVGIKRGETKYILIENNSEFPIFHEDGNTIRAIGGKDTNGYLFQVCYWEKRITFDFLHALGDGTGFVTFVKSVIFRYLQLADFPVENDGTILTVDQAYTEEEGENAIRKIMNLPASLPEWFNPGAAFQIPGTTTDGDPSDTIVEIRMPFDRLYSIVKSYRSTPVIFIESLFSDAIYEQYKSTIGDKNIIAFVPVNLRPFFPSATTRYFFTVAVLTHNRDSSQEDFLHLLEAKKKYLYEQTKPEFLAYLVQKQAKGVEMLMSMPCSIEEKTAMMNYGIEAALKSYTYIITNMGNFALPASMASYIADFVPVLPTATIPFTIAFTTWNGQAIFSISQRSDDTSVCRRFVERLNKHDASAYIADVYKFHTMRYLPL